MRLAVLAFVLLAGGCAEQEISAKVAETPMPPPARVTCAVDLAAPVRLIGANTGPTAGDLSHCYLGRWDDVMQLHFRAVGVAERYLRINVDTKAVKVGWPVELGAGAAAVWSDACSRYDGYLILGADEPDWSLTVVAECSDDPDAPTPLVGRWWGHS